MTPKSEDDQGERVGTHLGLLGRAALLLENVQLKHQVELLNTLHAVGKSLTAMLDLGQILLCIVEAAVSITGAEEGSVMLLDQATRKLFIRAQKGLGDKVAKKLELGVDDSLAGNVVKARRPVRIGEKTKLVTGYIVNAIAYVPLISQNSILGVLSVSNRQSEQTFDQEDEHVLSILANYAAVAVENARVVQELRDKNQALASMYEAGRSMSSAASLTRVLDQIVQSVLVILKADNVIIYRYSNTSDEIVAPPIIAGNLLHPELLQAKAPFTPERQSAIFKLVQRGEPFYAPCAQRDWLENGLTTPRSDLEPHSYFEREEVASSAGIPLIADDETVGILFINYRSVHEFDTTERDIAEVLANQAAIAIKNAQLLETESRLVDQLTAVNIIGQTIGLDRHLEIHEILETVYKQTTRLMDATNFYVAFYEKEQGRVSFEFAIERGQRQQVGTGIWRDRTSGNGLTEYVIHSRTPLLIPRSVEEWLERHNVECIGELARSWVGAPMIAQSEVLGVIGVQNYDTESAYDKNDMLVLSTIASQAAIATQNARLLREKNSRFDELESLYKSLDITRELELEPLLRAIAQRAASLLQAPSGGLLLREGVTQNFVMRVTHNLVDMDGIRFKLGQGMVGRVAQSAKPLCVNEYHLWEGRDRRFDNKPFSELWHAAIQVPLKRQDDVIGVLAVSDTDRHRQFTDNDVNLLQRFADSAVSAIENAMLFNRKVMELKALRKADTALLSTMDLEEMLCIILNELSDLVACDCIAIQLWDEERKELVLKQQPRGDYRGKVPPITKPGRGISGRAAWDRKTTVSTDVRQDPDYRRLIDATPDTEEKRFLQWIRSEVAVPMTAKDKLVGILTAFAAKKDGIHAADIELMESFANQAAIALHNAQLVQQSRQHTVLVSHQLKGPLQGIRGDVDRQVSYLQRRYGDDDQLQRLHRRIGEHFGKLKKELDNFSFLVRDDLGVGHRYTFNLLPIMSVMDEVVLQFRETARFRGIEIRVDPSVRGSRANMDRENMLTVFTNLIENAVKYSHDNKTVEIKAEKKLLRLEISIADYGLGVLPDDEDRIFELYTQGRLKDEKRFVQGTGIGLWVAREIVRAHGGDITVWSQLFEHPELFTAEEDVIDRGFLTVFTVELPS